jgi:hypothetical protein
MPKICILSFCLADDCAGAMICAAIGDARTGTPPMTRSLLYSASQERPALVYIPSYQRALVAWQDGRSTAQYDIYASFGAVDVTPPASPHPI